MWCKDYCIYCYHRLYGVIGHNAIKRNIRNKYSCLLGDVIGITSVFYNKNKSIPGNAESLANRMPYDSSAGSSFYNL